ncbi:MAG TPA: hypothetical protein VGX78_22125 [Pirellulales bacterium]|nr:hypothetical protein [Pirellulales bacterium]
MDADDETRTTEITILPDGRICLFGASRAVLEILGEMRLGDAALDQRLAYLRALDAQTTRTVSSETVDVAGTGAEGRSR